MKRTAPLRRGAPLRRAGRLGRRAAARRRAGGPLVTSRRALTRAGLTTLRRLLVVRAASRCERCRYLTLLEMDHAVPRSAGGADSWENCSMLCGGPSGCHRMKDEPLERGRLYVEPLGDGRFLYEVRRGASKRGPLVVLSSVTGGRPPTPEEQRVLQAL